MTSEDNQERFHNTMLELANQIKLNAETIKNQVILNIIDLILQVFNSENRIFVYGAGRSGFVGRCFAQRLMHLGMKSCFVSDAVTHQYANKDLLILISGSGETASSIAIAKKAKEIGGSIVLFSTNPNSSIGKISKFVIEVKGKSKDAAITKETLAPYTSLFDISTLSVLDSIGSVLMNVLKVSEHDIDKRHASIE